MANLEHVIPYADFAHQIEFAGIEPLPPTHRGTLLELLDASIAAEPDELADSEDLRRSHVRTAHLTTGLNDEQIRNTNFAPREATLEFRRSSRRSYEIIRDDRTSANGHPTLPLWNGLMILQGKEHQ